MNTNGVDLDEAGVARWLREHHAPDATAVEAVGAGAWSRGFGFTTAEGDFVIRIGDHVDDFEKDRIASRYRSVDLPIPEVVAIGRASRGYYAISTRVHGTPLEQCAADDWQALAPSVVRLLGALRDAAPVGAGFGGWDHTGNAQHPTWRSFLLAVADDGPTRRTHGWSEKLRRSEHGDAAFGRFLQRLDDSTLDGFPRSIIHGDLINRNVHVDDDRVTGVFDWGCSTYGDHLYDLAWFVFWSPWHPNLDLTPLRATTGDILGDHIQQRLLACLLHIGLDHIAYNAHLDDWREVANVERRLSEVWNEHR